MTRHAHILHAAWAVAAIASFAAHPALGQGAADPATDTTRAEPASRATEGVAPPVTGTTASPDAAPAPAEPATPAQVKTPPVPVPEPAPAPATPGPTRADIGKAGGGADSEGAAQPVDPEASKLVLDCDRLAADPASPDRPEGVAGTDLAAFDAKSALAACRAAAARFPEHGRTQYQLGRAAQAAGAWSEAYSAYSLARLMDQPRAAWALGMLIQSGKIEGQGPDRAIAPLLAAAQAGVAEAQFELGFAYETGLGLPASPQTAASWYGRAAAAGELRAVNNLGWLFAEGRGVTRDEARAVALYKTAAEGGLALGMTNYGWMLQNGIGAAQDLKTAAMWYRTAAEHGETGAMLDLGALYFYGDGVPRDPDQALAWYRRAEAAGDPKAWTYLGEVYETSAEFYDPEQAARYYVEALKGGDDWPALRQTWDRPTALALQQLLIELGTYPGPLDGQVGPGTRRGMQALLPDGD